MKSKKLKYIISYGCNIYEKNKKVSEHHFKTKEELNIFLLENNQKILL